MNAQAQEDKSFLLSLSFHSLNFSFPLQDNESSGVYLKLIIKTPKLWKCAKEGAKC